MALTKTTVTLIAVGCLAVGIGATYMATRPATLTVTDPDMVSTLPVTDQGVVPAITEPDPPAPVPVAESAPAVATPPARPRQPVEQPTRPQGRPASQTPAHEQSTPSVAPGSGHGTDARPAPLPPPAQAVIKPVEPTFEELVVSADAVIGLQMDTLVSSEDAQVEDKVSATVTRDVRVGDRVAIPAGSRAQGEVTLVERGGKVKERARLAVRFTSVTLGNGARVPISTEAILREGASASKESAAKIGGGAIGGAIIGGIIGGKKGAAIGSTVGAGAGTTAVMAGGRNAAVFESGAALSVKLLKPATVTIDR